MRHIKSFNAIKESTEIGATSSLFEKVLSASIDSIFGESNSMLVLNQESDDAEQVGEFLEESGSEEIEIQMAFSLICIDPNLCEELEKIGESKKFSLHVSLISSVKYRTSTRWSNHGSDDYDINIYSCENTVNEISLWASSMDEPTRFNYSPYFRKIETYIEEESELLTFLSRKHFNFIPSWL